jgi:transcriptional regulator with XRE-family HTH domain
MISLGGAFKALRLQNGLTQDEASKRMDCAPSSISKIESSGQHDTGTLMISKATEAYGLDPYILFKVAEGLDLKPYKEALAKVRVERKTVEFEDVSLLSKKRTK